jgi:hypothetical protein
MGEQAHQETIRARTTFTIRLRERPGDELDKAIGDTSARIRADTPNERAL